MAAAQNEAGIPGPDVSASVTAVTAEINIDGLLNERDWATAPTIGELTQREPDTGARPTERTDVRLLHDANYLYVGVMNYDSEPNRILGTQMARDGGLGADDRAQRLRSFFRCAAGRIRIAPSSRHFC